MIKRVNHISRPQAWTGKSVARLMASLSSFSIQWMGPMGPTWNMDKYRKSYSRNRTSFEGMKAARLMASRFRTSGRPCIEKKMNYLSYQPWTKKLHHCRLVILVVRRLSPSVLVYTCQVLLQPASFRMCFFSISNACF